MRFLAAFSESRIVNLISALVLLATSLWEIVLTAEEGIGAEHGVFLFSIVSLLKVVPHLHEASENFENVKRSKREAEQ